MSYRLQDGDPGRLDSQAEVEAALEAVVRLAGLSEVGRAHHRFTPQGLSAVLLLSESHLAVHTWPESATAYVTLTSCRGLGEEEVERIGALLADRLGARSVTSKAVTL